MSVNIIDFIKKIYNNIKLFSEDVFVTQSDLKKFYLLKDLTPYVSITASSDWTIADKNLRITGNLMTLYINAYRNSNISAGAISNLQIATISIPTYTSNNHCPPLRAIYRTNGANSTNKGPNAFYTNTSSANEFTIDLTSTHAAISSGSKNKINTTVCFPVVFSSGSDFKNWVRGW